MRGRRFLTVLIGIALACGAGAVPAAADPHKGKHKFEESGERYKYEYKSRGCKYEYEFNYRTGREKIEQKGNCGRLVPAYGPRPAEHVMPRAVPVVPMGTSLVSCNRDLLGGLIGGVLGGLAGAQFGKGTGKLAATAGGTLVGVLVGGSIGRSMDRLDHACVGQALEHARPGQGIVWDNPEQQSAYEVRPTRTFQDSGRYCREYTTTATIAGKRQQVYGTACRQPDGSWQLMS